MALSPEMISRAVLVYKRRVPCLDSREERVARVRELMSDEEDCAAAIRKIDAISADLNGIIPDWEAIKKMSALEIGLEIAKKANSWLSKSYDSGDLNFSLIAATHFAMEEIKRKHPELNEEALELLGNSYAYGWK